MDRLADVRLHAQLDAGFPGEPRQVADPLDRFSRGSLVAHLAAGADVDDRHPQLPREPEQPSKPLAIGGRRFHGGGLETELCEQRLHGGDRIADVDVLAHPGDGGQFHVPVPRPRHVLQRGP